MARKTSGTRVSTRRKHAASRPKKPATSLATTVAGGDPIKPGDADNVAYDCTTRITGTDLPFDPDSSLERYGVHTEVQCQLITVLIVNDRNIGVPAYGCHMSANDLRDLGAGWKMGTLSDRIAAAAVH
jgi:hypothetical protein